MIVSLPKHWISSSLIHFINLFIFSNIFFLYITSGSSIFKPFILKFSYSIYESIISAISVPYLSNCLSFRSLSLLVSPISGIVVETPENDLLLFITLLFVFTCSKSISLGYGY